MGALPLLRLHFPPSPTMDGPSAKQPMTAGIAGDKAVEIGIIGMGDMGRLYATKLALAGWR